MTEFGQRWVAAAGVLVLVAGAVVAAAQVGAAPSVVSTTYRTTYKACADRDSGAIRLAVKPRKCRKSEIRLTWNAQGPAGPQGAVGAQGAQGPTGPQGVAGQPGEPWDHDHNDRYYTKDEVNAAFGLTKSYVDYWKPVAFGHISGAGVVVNGTQGLASTYNPGSQWYEITIPGLTYAKDRYVTIVTPVTYLIPIVTTTALGGKLIVSMTDGLGTPATGDFGFVTFAT